MRKSIKRNRYQYGNLLKGKAFVSLAGLNAKVGTKIGLNGVGLNISIGGNRHHHPGGSNPGIAHEIAALSAMERHESKKKCGPVLSNPTSFNRDAVQVCRVLAQLAGI